MVASKYRQQFVLKWMNPPIIENVHLNAYDAHDYLEYENRSQLNRFIGVNVVLCRKLSYHIVNIYIPTLCLIMIAGFTLFIDFSRFEATIMVALTTMLVKAIIMLTSK